MSTKPIVCRTPLEFQQQLRHIMPVGSTLGFVPTMGALHSGHQQLIRNAAQRCDVVAISVFVNPLQFDRNEDFQNYPRNLETDLQLAAEAGVQLVFAPEQQQLYPNGTPQVSVTAGKLGTVLEGALRPGHFDGVCTVVAKLLNIITTAVPPTTLGVPAVEAFFGQKDAQQLAIITAMVEDLNLPVRIHAVPIVRDKHGLALSSRNQRLNQAQLVQARVLFRALQQLQQQALKREPLDVQAALALINEQPQVRADELSIVDAATLEPLTEEVLAQPRSWPAELLALVSAFVGPVRLIDNMVLKGNS